MIIQVFLISGLALCLVYALLQRRKSRLVSSSLATVSLAGIYLVLDPDRANELAHLAGVGRGADLVLYCWVVISLVVSVNLQFKIMALRENVTELARALALQEANRSAAVPADHR
jgi:small membrane protein